MVTTTTTTTTTAKPHLSVVTIGHFDSGKSTIVGHFLFNVGCVSQRTIDKYERESTEIGKGSFKFAWLTDSTREERERGISINTASMKFETTRRVFTLTDAPGHRTFIKNAIAGIAQADTALLVVSAGVGEFEAGFALNAQTREHALLAFTLGIKQLVVAVNKMDGATVAFSRDRFGAVKRDVRAHLEQIGFDVSAILFVPISGWCGDNLVDRSERNMPWYDGPTLLEALDTLEEPRRVVDKPLRVTIQNSYKISGIGTVATGRVETGVLTPGTTVVLAPSGLSAVVSSIERHHTMINEALPGDAIGFVVRGLNHREIHRGDVASDAKLDPARATVEFTAQLIILNASNEIRRGYSPIVHCHTAMSACRIKAITAKIDRLTGKVVEKNPESVRTGDACTVVLVPVRALTVETYQQYPALGRIAVRDGGKTIAVGMIKAVTKVEKRIAKPPVAVVEPQLVGATDVGDTAAAAQP